MKISFGDKFTYHTQSLDVLQQDNHSLHICSILNRVCTRHIHTRDNCLESRQYDLSFNVVFVLKKVKSVNRCPPFIGKSQV